jgi:transposase
MLSSPTVPDYRCFVGIDIAATSFTTSWTTDGHTLPRALTYAQNPAGFAAFQRQLQATGCPPPQTLVVLEATGSYWVSLAVTLHEAGYAVAVVNPAHLHNYAQSLPRRGKTDALDAQVCLRFAAERKPAPWTPPPAVYHELRQCLVARDGLLSMRQQARNQRHALEQWPIVVGSVLTHLDGVIAEVDQHLGA